MGSERTDTAGPFPTPDARIGRIASLPELLGLQSADRPDAPAILTATETVSFSQLERRAAAIAGAIVRDGFARGARVGLLAGNGPDWIAICFGALKAGLSVVPISTWSTADELAFQLDDAKIELLFLTPSFGAHDFSKTVATLVSAKRYCGRTILLADDEAYGFDTLRSYLYGAVPLAWTLPDQGVDDALIPYTSGSTSAPKGVRLIHRDIVANGYQIGERLGLRPDDRVLLCSPLFWSYGSVNALPATFSHGAALVVADRFDPAGALRLIAQHRCTAIYTLPAITNALLRCDDFTPAMTVTLRTGLTIGSVQDFERAAVELGARDICNLYGATETYGNCCVTPHVWPIARRATCQGPPLPGQELRIRDPDSGAILGTGSIGLVEVRGRVTPGYTGRSAVLNAEILSPDGFYRTGDMGYLDKDGVFVFVARDSEMIKRSGINVSPAEVEEVVRAFPGIEGCVVVGVPDTERDEIIFAWVIPADCGTIDLPALRAHCAARLSKYKIPDHIEPCSAFPTTTTGKLQRREARTHAAALLLGKRVTAQ